ncbi:Ig-like domain-containing protein [Sandarakinorhabdus rubra]|uniref:Ig-like domain-containing protein n=1 Tax=Sandarakinorhabdus rubra TaxID=2672568 RepID=UPI0013DA4B98|nr:choice-of-anchor D domain-containing protein [Sandarakinorhabdus rubra]
MATRAQAVVPLQISFSASPTQLLSNFTQTRVGPGTSDFTNVSTIGTVSITRFDLTTGILVGAQATVNTSYALTAGVTGVAPGNGSGRTIDATVNQTASISIGGATIAGSSISLAPKCDGGDCNNSPNNNSRSGTGTISGTATLTDLASVAGTGPGTTLFTARSSGTNRIVNGANITSGSVVSNYSLGSTTPASNQYSITYNYLKFSAPSLSPAQVQTSQTIDFGTVFAGSGPVSQNFTVANLGDINTAGTSLIGTGRATNNTNFSTTLTSLTNLAAGASQNFQLAFNPTTVGTNSETFTFSMQDYAPGGVGLKTTPLVITANARVINHANPSFDPLVSDLTTFLNFGNLQLGSGPVTLDFILYNIGDNNSAGLQLISFTNLTSNFTTNFTQLANLPGGQSRIFSMTFDPGTLGLFQDIFTFNLADFAPQVPGGQNYTLTVTTRALVFDGTEPVPEPGTWLTMLTGFGLIGVISRRRAAVRSRAALQRL